MSFSIFKSIFKRSLIELSLFFTGEMYELRKNKNTWPHPDGMES